MGVKDKGAGIGDKGAGGDNCAALINVTCGSEDNFPWKGATRAFFKKLQLQGPFPRTVPCGQGRR